MMPLVLFRYPYYLQALIQLCMADYVNKHSSVLQTTSYNFTQTSTTPEVCVVVKATPIHKKNPTRPFSDL